MLVLLNYLVLLLTTHIITKLSEANTAMHIPPLSYLFLVFQEVSISLKSFFTTPSHPIYGRLTFCLALDGWTDKDYIFHLAITSYDLLTSAFLPVDIWKTITPFLYRALLQNNTSADIFHLILVGLHCDSHHKPTNR